MRTSRLRLLTNVRSAVTGMVVVEPPQVSVR